MRSGLNTDVALDLALFAHRVRQQPKLPHSFGEEVQRLSVRAIAALHGRTVPLIGAVGADDAEAVLSGVLDALRASGVSGVTIAEMVNRYAERSASPAPPVDSFSSAGQAVAQ